MRRARRMPWEMSQLIPDSFRSGCCCHRAESPAAAARLATPRMAKVGQRDPRRSPYGHTAIAAKAFTHPHIALATAVSPKRRGVWWVWPVTPLIEVGHCVGGEQRGHDDSEQGNMSLVQLRARSNGECTGSASKAVRLSRRLLLSSAVTQSTMASWRVPSVTRLVSALNLPMM